MWIWSMVLGLGEAQATCSGLVRPSELSQQMSLAEAAYINLEAEDFAQHLAGVRADVACLSEPLNDAQATALFRLEALSAFLGRDQETAKVAFWAVLGISPNYSLSPSLAPEGHPLQAWFFEAFETQNPLTAPLAAPRRGTVWIDGRPAQGTVPLGRPYLFQWVDEDGVLAISTVVAPGQTLPDYPAAGGARLDPRWAIAAGTATVVAGGAWLLARRGEQDFNDPATPTAELEGLRTRTNALSATSMGVGVVAVGAGAAAVLVRVW